MIIEEFYKTETIFNNAFKNTTLRLANYGLIVETNIDWSNIKLAQEFISYCIYNETFLKDTIQTEMDDYGLGLMSDFNYVFLMNYLSFHLKLDDETVRKVVDALLSKAPKRLSKDKALDLYMMKVFINDVEVDLHPYFEIIFSLNSYDVDNSFPEQIEMAFIKGIVINAVKMVRHDCFGIELEFTDEQRQQLGAAYLRFCARFERELKKDIYDMCENTGDDDETSWLGFMAYKFLKGAKFDEDECYDFGHRIMNLPDEEPNMFEFANFMDVAYKEGNESLIHNLTQYMKYFAKKAN